MIFDENRHETILKGEIKRNETLICKYIIFKTDKKDNYSFIRFENKNNVSENSFNDIDLMDIIKSINDFDNYHLFLKEHYKNIYDNFKSFYNFTYINKEIIKKVSYILSNCLSVNEIRLYNQDFDNTKDEHFNFTENTFYNNCFNCLKECTLFYETYSNNIIIKEIVHYFMKVFISCCIECNKSYDEIY